MNASQLFHSFVHTYKLESIAKNSECLNNRHIDCCLIDKYSGPDDLWNMLIHAIFNANHDCHIFIDAGSRICPGNFLPYSASLAMLAVASAIDADILTVDSLPTSTIIIKVYGTNIHISKNSLNSIDFSRFNTRIASNMCCGSLNVRKAVDIPWISQCMSTLPYTGEDKVDIVFTLAGENSRTDNEELRIALRSIEKHAKDLGNVYIVTDNAPKWLDNVNIIHAHDIYTDNKDANLITKLLKACVCDKISDRFMYWSDDQVLTSDISLKHTIPVYNDRGIDHFSSSSSRWGTRMRHTLELVRDMGGDASCNWDSHVPQPIDKIMFSHIMGSLDFSTQPGLCVNTAYFGIKGEAKQCCQSSVKLTYENTDTARYDFNKVFVGYNDEGYFAGLREALLAKFPDKSKYEKK